MPELRPFVPKAVPSATCRAPPPSALTRAGAATGRLPSSLVLPQAYGHLGRPVESDQVVRVRVGGVRAEVAGAGHDAHLTGAQELPDGGRGLHDLVGLVLAEQGAGTADDPDVAAVRVQVPELVTGHRVVGGVAAFDHLVLAVGVEVGDGGGGENGVGVEERPPGEDSHGVRVEGVAQLAHGPGHHVQLALQVPDGQAGSHAGGARSGDHLRVLHEGSAPGAAELGVAASRVVSGVAQAHVHVGAGGGGSRVDRDSAGADRPAGHLRAVAQVQGVDVAGPITDEDGGPTAVQGGHCGRGLGDRAGAVRDRDVPRQLDVGGGRGRSGAGGDE